MLSLDLDMAAMDGFEFLEHLRAEASAAPLPAIVLTSMSISEPNRRRLSTATRIVAKSDITGDVLVGAIRAAVGDRDARPE